MAVKTVLKSSRSFFPMGRHLRKTSPAYAAPHWTKRETKKTMDGWSIILIIRRSSYAITFLNVGWAV